MGKTFKIKIVGALRRSTVGKEVVNPEVEAINDAIHWIWSVHLQYDRLLYSFENELKGNELAALDRRKAFSRTTFDEHVLLVAGRNLVRAIKRLNEYFPEIKINSELSESIKLLRDIYEHWDEHRNSFRLSPFGSKRSLKKFLEKFPEGYPWSISYGGDGPVLGGVINLNKLMNDLYEIEKILLELENKSKSNS